MMVSFMTRSPADIYVDAFKMDAHRNKTVLTIFAQCSTLAAWASSASTVTSMSMSWAHRAVRIGFLGSCSCARIAWEGTPSPRAPPGCFRKTAQGRRDEQGGRVAACFHSRTPYIVHDNIFKDR